tara:strand:+ start:7359 stop:7844 length:486 start_codon:yes stop_codon:yes gene_type:complete
MKNVEVLGNAEALKKLDLTGIAGIKLSYAIISNARALEAEAKNITESIKYPQEYTDLKEKGREQFKEHALVDDKGELVIEDNKYVIDPEKAKAYDTLITAVDAENKGLLEKVQAIEEEYNTFLEEDSTFKVVAVKLSDLPEKITPVQMATISFMVKEFEPE